MRRARRQSDAQASGAAPDGARGELDAATRNAAPDGARRLGLLVLPALVFVLLVFLAPVGRFLWLAVYNHELTSGLPRTIEALAALPPAEPEPMAAPAPEPKGASTPQPKEASAPPLERDPASETAPDATPGVALVPPLDAVLASPSDDASAPPKDEASAPPTGMAPPTGVQLSPLPPEPVFAALVADLAEARASRRDGVIAQALNQRLPGTRLLVIRTAQAAEAGAFSPPYRESVTSAFPAWADPALWQVLESDSGPLTAFHLLTSLDLRMTADGAITDAPPEQSQFRRILMRTLWISAVVTLICAVLGLPLAQAIVSAPRPLGRVLLALVLFPLWTSLLVRTVVWIIVLQKNGPVNAALLRLGLTTEPLALIYTRFSLYLAMVQVLLPLMVLSLVAVLGRIPPSYMRAALSLGASWHRAWLSVQLPLLLPGLLAGAGIVFVFALGYYVTPLLVGGPAEQMISSLIAFYTNETLNWGLAAALSLQVMLLVLAAGGGALIALRLRAGFAPWRRARGGDPAGRGPGGEAERRSRSDGTARGARGDEPVGAEPSGEAMRFAPADAAARHFQEDAPAGFAQNGEAAHSSQEGVAARLSEGDEPKRFAQRWAAAEIGRRAPDAGLPHILGSAR